MTSHGVAFVTGASQGIGRAIALRLAGDGFDVAVNDIPTGKENLDTLSQEIVDTGRKTCVLLGDVSVESDVEGMINAVVERMGRLDVVGFVFLLLFTLIPNVHMQMVANAGICITKSILESMSYHEQTLIRTILAND
jgi:NAD(P)-dependent dehydrogenase (short-subunit alcohol dehydrogenase family)